MTTAHAAVDAYLDHLTAEVGASAHTVSAYRRDLGRYVAHLDAAGIQAVGAISSEHVSSFAASLREGVPVSDATPGRPPLAASSTARALAAVRSFHAFAQRDGETHDNPAARVSPPKQGRRLPKALSLDQVQRLLDAPDTSTTEGLRDVALLELLYGTGGRVSEIVGLDVDDVSSQLDDPDLGLRLFGKGRKERMVPLGSYARTAIAAWLTRGRPGLIAKAARPGPALLLNSRGDRLSRQSAFNVLRLHAGRAGLNVEISPHTLRHSFATHLLDGGADVRVVQELLGHASVSTTQIYTMVTAEHLREVFLTAHPRAR